jgi:hypothetical protein
MFGLRLWCPTVVCLAIVAATTVIQANGHRPTLVVTMTNDPAANQIKVVRRREPHAAANAVDPRQRGRRRQRARHQAIRRPTGGGRQLRNGSFTSIIAAGQEASCWMTRAGKYVFVANTGSRSISRLIGTGNNIFIDSERAAQTPTGSPADIDANGGVIGIGVADANGVAILSPPADARN